MTPRTTRKTRIPRKPRTTRKPKITRKPKATTGSHPTTIKKGNTQTSIPFCDSDRIQTCNLLIRSQVLYSVELRNH